MKIKPVLRMAFVDLSEQINLLKFLRDLFIYI